MPHGEWLGYYMVKNFEDVIIRFDRIYERDGGTDRQTETPHDGLRPVYSDTIQLNSTQLN